MSEYEFPAFDELPSQPYPPDPLVKPDGGRVETPEEWESQREYWKKMLSHYFYGERPPSPGRVTGKVLETKLLYNGAAMRERVLLAFGPDGTLRMEIYVIRPNRAGRFPVVTWNCFESFTVCPIEQQACERGYAIAMFEKGQICPDDAKTLGTIHTAYPEYRWKAIAVWAWEHSVVADYLQTTDYADCEKLIAAGHSRGGKAALCAGIYDERFKLVMANNSGCGGCGCLRFLGGRDGLTQDPTRSESVGRITTAFPHWFADEFARFGDTKYPHIVARETRLPFDMNVAASLIAPRALVSDEGFGDEWANTFGSQLTHELTKKVYAFLNAEEKLAIHFREGGHMFGEAGWTVMLDFADNALLGKSTPYSYEMNNYPFASTAAELARANIQV